MPQLTYALAAVVAAAAFGCAHASDLRDSFDKSQYYELFDHKLRVEVAAPVILAGRVVKVTQLGGPRRSAGDPSLKTQLTRITIDVENVIKGSVTASPVDFLYYIFSPENTRDLARLRYIPEIGQRRIFFLTSGKGHLRSIGDVTDYTLRLASGRHGRDFCYGQEPGCCIARILLTPGESEIDNDAFARSLVESEYVAEVLCSPTEARGLLQSLVQYPDQRVAAGARATLAMVLPH